MGLHLCFHSSRPGGISELYATMLMVGVTLTLGGLVTSAALGQFALANSSASLGASRQVSSGGQIGLVYLAAAASGSCPAYEGHQEGTSVSLAFYDYGVEPFAPTEIVLNGSAYPGNYAPMSPGNMTLYALDLAACSHSSGQIVTLVDQQGDEVEFAT